MDPELIQQILFWAAVVFVAGFIGYFGKYLSKLILGKVHKKGPHGSKGKEGKPLGKEDYKYLIEKQKLKLEKKRMKSEEKRKEAEEKRREKEAERREKVREKRED